MSVRPLKILLCTLSASLIWPNLVFAHGEHSTGAHQNTVEPPKSFWEFFISSADSALTMEIKEAEGYRYLKTNGAADHVTGSFPNRGNPHSIQPKDRTYRVPLNPVKSSSPRPNGHADFGVAINGIPFDAATAEYWGGRRGGEWNYEAITGGMNLGLDSSNAHVQPDGTYHYHGLPMGLLNQHREYLTKPVLIGYAADGFPIYSPFGYDNANDAGSSVRELKGSYRIKSGTRPSGPGGRYDGKFTADWEYVAGKGDLDECNGREGVTPEYPQGTYYYVITEDFPYIPRCWVGEADDSFQKGPGSSRGMGGGNNRGGFGRSGGPGGPQMGGPGMQGGMNQGMGGGRQGGRRGPPPEAIEACEGKSSNASCTVETPHGIIRGSCRNIPTGDMACVPAGGPPPR